LTIRTQGNGLGLTGASRPVGQLASWPRGAGALSAPAAAYDAGRACPLGAVPAIVSVDRLALLPDDPVAGESDRQLS